MSDEKKTPEEAASELSDPRLKRPEPAAALVRSTQIGIYAGLALLLVALAWWGIARRLTLGPVIIGAVGILGVAFWIAFNLHALRQVAGTRGARLVFNSVGFILFVLGIVVCVNIIAARHHPRLDLTENKLYSLSPQTNRVLKDLTKDVRFIAFLPPEGRPSRERDLVQLYSSVSPRIKVQWADYTDVTLATKYKVTFPGTVIVESGEEPAVRQEKVTEVTESRLTSAILSVTTETKTVVYFLVGHGEASTTGGGDNSVSTLKSDLTNQQYEVKDLDMTKMASPQVPADCGVLAIVGAKQAPAAQEMAAIEKWVDNRGKLLLALAAPATKGASPPDFSSLLNKRGVRVLPGIVVDPELGYLGQPTVPVVSPKPGSPLTEGIDRVVLPLCRALKVESKEPPPSMPESPVPPPSGPAKALLESSSGAWLLTDLGAGLQRPANAESGPFVLAATIDESPPAPPTMPGAPPPPEQEQDATRIVVLGSDLALNDTLIQSFRFNADLALNAIAWLSKNVRLISIPPKQEIPRNLLLRTTQKNFIIFVVMFFIPLAVIVAGASVWWTRRK